MQYFIVLAMIIGVVLAAAVFGQTLDLLDQLDQIQARKRRKK